VATYTDTVLHPGLLVVDEDDGRIHKPLGVAVEQISYSWSPQYAEDFVIVELTIRNTLGHYGQRDCYDCTIHGLYVGLAAWVTARYNGYGVAYSQNDDITGFLRTAVSPLRPDIPDEFNITWWADNDGDPEGGAFDRGKATSVVGVAVMTPQRPSLALSYNWWDWSGPSTAPYNDWGPVRKSARLQFPHGGLGAPQGDRGRYQMMSNGEIDYPQVETAISHEAEGWLPPPSALGFAEDVANGTDVFFLVSQGPFDLEPDSSVKFAFAIVAGEGFHRYADNLSLYFDPKDPEAYVANLDFTDLLRNTQWANWVYDNPGVDTDGDGYRGKYYVQGQDTVYYRGDGVPDLKGALPPNPPTMRLFTQEGQVTIQWNGQRTETEKDLFTLRPDFEGYRLYMSRTGRREDDALLTQRDLVNYARYTWNDKKAKWEFKDPPYTLDSLKTLYDSASSLRYGYPFHPDSFDIALVDKALLVEWLDPVDPSILDTLYYYFSPYAGNQTPNDKVLAQTVEAGTPVTNVIRKVYPDAKIEDTLYRDDGTPFLPYYEYEYVIDHLQLAEPVFFALTAFDHGDPISGLEPLESSVTLNAQEVWAINSAEVVKSTRPKPGVYPNPYKFSEYYNASGWENPRGLEPDPERARKVTFFNVPDTCVVSIWSIDGDLVRRLEHREPPSSSEVSVVIWNLITRNTQAVKTGIYLYSIESRFGVDTGKLVIIK
jgi:hypothetical protein